MANYLKRLIMMLIVIVMVIGVTGCLSGGGGGKEKPPVIVDPTDPTDPIDPTDPTDPTDPIDTVVYVPYNPNGNKAPKVTAFNTNDLSEAVVSYGQKVKFEGAGLDPEGSKITMKYEATGGSFSGNVWTAPNTAGYYQVMAYAIDDNGLKSDPAIITIRVEKPVGEGNIRLSNVPKILKGEAVRGKRPISINEGETFNQAYNFILSTRTQDDNHTATIEIVFTDPAKNHNFTFSAEKGMVSLVSEEATGTANEYKLTLKYTAPTAATIGDDWNSPVTITIYNKSDLSDKDTITLPFIVNTPPTITNVQFRADSGASSQVIGLNKSAAIEVTVTDPNATQGDTLIYTFNIINGEGTVNPATTNLGWSDFTAPATRQQVYINVQVIDSKGGMAQKTFTAYVQDPMTVIMGKAPKNTLNDLWAKTGDASIDSAKEDADAYEVVADEDTNKYRVGYRIFTSTYAMTPISNLSTSIGNAPDDANIEDAGIGYIAQYYFTGAPEGAERGDTTHSVAWKVLNASGDEIKGGDNDDLGTSGATKATGFDFQPSNNVYTPLKGGIKTLKATVTADMDIRTVSDTVRINTHPYIEYVNFNTEDGTGIMYDQTNGVQTVQLSRGQKVYLNVGVYDQDNNDFDPQTTDYDITKTSGFFINQVGDTITNPKPGLIITPHAIGIEGVTTDAALASSTINVGAVAKNNYNTRFTGLEFEVPETATLDVTTGLGQTYHYLYVNATDGTIISSTNGSGQIDFYPVPYEMVTTNTDARGARIATVAGKTSYNRRLVLEIVTKTGTSTLVGKIKDLDTGAYWKNSTGSDVEISINGDANLTAADVVDATNEANNWLAIDLHAAHWKAGDKVYFDTFANTVVLKYQVVDGPKVMAVNSMKYSTIGDTKGTPVVVLGSVDNSKTARVTITIPDSTHGTITQGTDSDGDNVLNEVWQYVPPTQMPSLKQAKLLITITEVDVENPKRTIFEHTIHLNYPPQIVGVSADGAEEGGNNEFWVLKGSKNVVAMNTRITDQDATDRFKVEWGLQDGNAYGLMYQDGTYDITGLGETSGKYGNGRIDVQVSVRDFDADGVEKTGYDYRPAILGINEAPRVRNMALADGVTTSALNAANPSTSADMQYNSDNDANFNDTHEFPNAELEFTFDTTLVTKEVEDATEDENAGLNYEWYVSADDKGNTPLLNVGTFYSEPQLVNSVMTNRLHWIPNDHVRVSGGTYYVNAIVSDDKPGKAQGRTRVTLPVTITADDVAPTPASTHAAITKVRDNGTANVYGIGDQIKIKIPLLTGVTGDLDYAVVDMSDISSPSSLVMLTNPNKSKHGIDYDYSNDYVEYVYTIPKAATTAGGIDSATAPTGMEVTYYDMFGNTASATALALTTISGVAAGGFDNIIDGEFDATSTTALQLANENTTLADIDTVLDPGDEITFTITATDDLTSAYTVATSAALSGLGFIDEKPTSYANGAFVWTVSLSAVGGASYQNTDDDVVLTATITDDAGNKQIVEVTAGGLLAAVGTATAIDLVRPQVYTAMLFSYSYGTNGVLGGGDDKLIDSNGQVYATLTTNITAAGITTGAITDDGSYTTAEIAVVMFDKAMNTNTINDQSIKIRRNDDGKIFSVGTSTGSAVTTAAVSMNNYGYAAAWTDDPATINRNTAFITFIDPDTDAATSVSRGSVIEVLFTDNDDPAIAGVDIGVVTDSKNIEVDTGLADFRVGRNALTW